MRGLLHSSSITRELSKSIRTPFTLVDVGCSGGIDKAWRSFQRLRAFGFDPNLDEVRRLTANERDPNVRYVPGFVELPKGHPLRGKTQVSRNPWDRLSVARTFETHKAMARSFSSEQLARLNLWDETPLAKPEQSIVLPEYLSSQGIEDVDFVKIDVDGKDLEVLVSLEEVFEPWRLLGLAIEVNFVGSDSATDNTFHNVDRFMRANGFALFNLSVLRYSTAALPGQYLYPCPAESEWGRPYQGDAIYMRDLADPQQSDLAAELAPDKLAKLVCLFHSFGIPDCAAELLVRYSEPLSEVCDPAALLEQLVPVDLPYREYTARFERDHPMFYRVPLFWIRRPLHRLRKRVVGALRRARGG